MKCKKLALRVLSTAAVLSIVSSIAAPAFADVYDLTKGDISVGFKNNQQTVTQEDGNSGYVKNKDGKEIKDLVDENVTITTKDAETDEVKTTDNTVTVKSDEGQTAKVTLEDVNIKSTGKAAMSVTGDGDVQLELNGNNTLTSTGTGHAGLEKNAAEGKGTLKITDDNEDGGSLTATGGNHGAGIGGGEKQDTVGIEIAGGVITANGGNTGAGIGGGQQGSGEVTITGGKVTANAGSYATGIGGGSIKGGKVTIVDGTVNANGRGGGGAAIGASGTASAEVTIKGGTINAKGVKGAGIGGGENSTITIEGGTITAVGGNGASGIGGTNSKVDFTKNESGATYIDKAETANHKHTWGAGAVTQEPGIDKAGETVYKCTDENCGATKTEYTPITGHAWDAGEVTTAPTCTETGIRTYTCTGCGATKTEVVKALGHDFGAWVPDGAGHKTRTCTRCNATETAADENYVAPKPDDTTPSGDSTPETDSTAAETVSYAPLRVVGAPAYEQTVKDGRVLIAVPAQSASLTGSLHALKELKAKGAEVLVFRTQLCESTVSIDTLLAQGTDATIFTLTHTEGAASLTVGGADHTDLLNK